ncbi:MAG: hypothetical protein ACK5MY_05430 [Jhaorihella sp.]
MSQIEELQSRIAAAMDRIGNGVEALAAGPGAAGSVADLTAALDEEKLANAQLGERLKSIKTRHEEDMQALRDELDRSGELDALKSDNGRLASQIETMTAANGELTAENAALKAQIEGLKTDAEAIAGEIERLKADLAAAEKGEAAQAEMDRLRAGAEEQGNILARLDMEVQRMRQSNDQLREVNARLREANSDGVGEPELINKAMLAEIEGLRAARASDATEAGAVLRKLETLLAGSAELMEGEDE